MPSVIVGSQCLLLPGRKGRQWKQRWDLTKRLAWMSAAAAGGVAVLALVAMLPVKNSIREPLVVLSERDEPVFVRTPGFIDVVERDVIIGMDSTPIHSLLYLPSYNMKEKTFFKAQGDKSIVPRYASNFSYSSK